MKLIRELMLCYIASIIVLFIVLFITKAIRAEELYTYKISGQNLHTGMRVVGQAWEQDKEGNIKAKVYDRMQIYDQCWGAWVAYGVMQVGCENGEQYVLEVVEK